MITNGQQGRDDMQMQQIFVAVLEVSSSCGTISLFPLGEIMLVYNNSSTLNKYYIYTLNEDFAKLVTTLYPVQSPKSQPMRTWYHTSSIPSSVYWTDTRYSTTPTQLPFQILLGNFLGFNNSTTGLIETNIDAQSWKCLFWRTALNSPVKLTAICLILSL